MAKPKTKIDTYHGGANMVSEPVVSNKGINFHVTFEEALKWHLAIQSCLLSLNKYDRREKAGKVRGLGIFIDRKNKSIKVHDSK